MSDTGHAAAIKAAAQNLAIVVDEAVNAGLLVSLDVEPIDVTTAADKHRCHRYVVYVAVSRPL